MNTKEAYELFKQGARVLVIVENAITGEKTAHEITEQGWKTEL